jgi:hypothetical protein
MIAGKGTAFDHNRRFGYIPDGEANTIFCVAAPAEKAVVWTKPEDLPFDPAQPLTALGINEGESFRAAFFDGVVTDVAVDNPTLAALITPDGGEKVETQLPIYWNKRDSEVTEAERCQPTRWMLRDKKQIK